MITTPMITFFQEFREYLKNFRPSPEEESVVLEDIIHYIKGCRQRYGDVFDEPAAHAGARALWHTYVLFFKRESERVVSDE